MEILYDLRLDSLTLYGVKFVKVPYVIVNDEKFYFNKIQTKAYSNSTSGRQDLAADLPEAWKNGVLAIWGETPLVPEVEEI